MFATRSHNFQDGDHGLTAAIYYCENLKTVRRVIEKLDEDDAVSTKKTKKYIVKPGLESNLCV